MFVMEICADLDDFSNASAYPGVCCETGGSVPRLGASNRREMRVAKVFRPERNTDNATETCDWGFFSGSHCSDIGVWSFGGEHDFSLCERHHAQLVEIHCRIPEFSRHFHAA